MPMRDDALVLVVGAGLLAAAVRLHSDQRRYSQDVAELSDQVRVVHQALEDHREESATGRAEDRKKVLSRVRGQLRNALRADRQQLTDVVSLDSARLAEVLRAEVALLNAAEATRSEALLAVSKKFAAETHAVHGLYARHRPRAPIRRHGGADPTPQQILDLLAVMHRTEATSICGFSLGEAAVWVGYEAADVGATVTAVVADAADQVTAEDELAAHHLTETVTVTHAPFQPVDVAHVYQPWHDLSGLPEDADRFELVLAVPGSEGVAPLLPLIPLLTPRLSTSAVIALASALTSDTRQLIGVWEANYGVQIDEALSSDDVTVLRLP